MKKLIMLLILSGVLPMTAFAQDDDMYFVPTKENVAKENANFGIPERTYYAGSNRSVDEYNRPYVNYIPDTMAIDSTGGDFRYTQRMSRFDDYTPSVAYWEGYRDGRWGSPWRIGWYSWYDPWYEPWYTWYDPWYYGSWYSWRSPWYYSSVYYSPYYGWGGRYGWGGYWGGGYTVPRGSGHSASRSGVTHHKGFGGRTTTSLGGYRGQGSRSGSSGIFSGNTGSSRSSNSSSSSSSRPANLGGSRSSGSYSSSSSGSLGGSRSSGSFSSGGSSGGSRSSGGSGRSGGGFSYGGRR